MHLQVLVTLGDGEWCYFDGLERPSKTLRSPPWGSKSDFTYGWNMNEHLFIDSNDKRPCRSRVSLELQPTQATKPWKSCSEKSMAMFLVCLKLGVVLSLGHLGAIIAFIHGPRWTLDLFIETCSTPACTDVYCKFCRVI